MSLIYDDEPGSWGRLSEGWSSIYDADGKVRELVIRDKLVPYGSYVTVGEYLRVEIREYVSKVLHAIRNEGSQLTTKKNLSRDEVDVFNAHRGAELAQKASGCTDEAKDAVTKILKEDALKRRLKDIERRLEDRGIVDVKFAFDRFTEATVTKDKMLADVCDVLEAVLNGDSTPAEPFGDSARG